MELVTVGVEYNVRKDSRETSVFDESKTTVARQAGTSDLIVGFAVGIDGLADVVLVFVKPGGTGSTDSRRIIRITTRVTEDDSRSEHR